MSEKRRCGFWGTLGCFVGLHDYRTTECLGILPAGSTGWRAWFADCNFRKNCTRCGKEKPRLQPNAGVEPRRDSDVGSDPLLALRQELDVTDKLLEQRQRVLDAIPECPVHGPCVPHALEWIEQAKAMMEANARPDVRREKGSDS